jgi:hypothetical protein
MADYKQENLIIAIEEQLKITKEIVTNHTIDNITYTIHSRSSETATMTLKQILDAGIAREIARIT